MPRTISAIIQEEQNLWISPNTSTQHYKVIMSFLNTPEFEKFKEKRQTWIACFSSQDRNSIIQQIYSMIWDAAVFNVINEAWKYAREAEEGEPEINWMAHRLIIECFLRSQAVAIRRFIDTYGIEGKKGVYSLFSLIEDMEQNTHLLKRQHFFPVENLSYDPEPVQESYEKYVKEQEEAGKTAYGIPAELDVSLIYERHEQIDKLAGVDKDHRLPDDTVRTDCFKRLKQKLVTDCEKIKDYVDKYIAHAATPWSRDQVNADDIQLNLEQLRKAHETICKIANFLDLYLLSGSSHYFLPLPHYEQLKYIDRPLITEKNIQHLHDVWQEYDQETASWSSWGLEEFEKEI
ncbi:hypothetical protein ACFL02_08375 [Planctomycetota bacterium]